MTKCWPMACQLSDADNFRVIPALTFHLPAGWKPEAVIKPSQTKWPREHLMDDGVIRQMEPGSQTQRSRHTIPRLLTPKTVLPGTDKLPSCLSHCYFVSLL